MVIIIPVLFVDDNRELANIFQFYLEETGLFTVHACFDGEDALEYLGQHDIQAVISDFDMPDMDGIALLQNIRARYPHLPFIMLTGNDSKETAIAALNAGADFYQNKGEDLEIQVLDLSHKLTILVEKARAEATIRRKDLTFEAIDGNDGRLLKEENFHDEMLPSLSELGRVAGAVGACTGHMPGDVPCLLLSRDWVITAATSKAADMLGTIPESLIQTSLDTWISAASHTGGPVIMPDGVMMKKGDGTIIPVTLSLGIISGHENMDPGYLVVLSRRDISA